MQPLRVQLKPDALEFGQLVPIVVGATYHGPAASLFVEPTYLHDAVVAAPGPVLAIEAVDETSPIVVRTPGDNSYLAVVVPVLVGTRGRASAEGSPRTSGLSTSPRSDAEEAAVR